MAKIKVNAPLIISGGIDSVSVVSSVGNASIKSDTLYLDFPASASNFTLNNQTVKGASITGADIAFDSGIANITIQSAEASNFSINGAEVQQVSLSGGDFVIDSANKIANVTLSGGIESVSVVSEAGNASINNKKLFLDFGTEASNFTVNGSEASAISISGAEFSFDAETKLAKFIISDSGVQKLSANLQITPQSLTFNDSTPQTVTVSHNGDGVISFDLFNEAVASVKQVSNTGYAIYPQGHSSAQSSDLFWKLSETAEYYPANKGISVTSNYIIQPQVLCHFEDSATPYLNENEDYTITSLANLPTIGADYGHFGNGARCYGTQAQIDNLFLGGKDFTIDFWAQFTNTQYGLMFITGELSDDVTTNIVKLVQASYRFGNAPADLSITLPSDFTTAMHHYAFTYQHNQKIGRVFIDGVLTATQEVEISRLSVPLKISFGHWYHTCFNQVLLDELRIWDGGCAWTEDFTLPTQPYV